ncbi:MAG: ABC transporter substrate-binding protein, partial [Nocardioidaceae bacterium]
MRRPVLATIAASGVLALVLSACGGGGKEAGADGLTDITVGAIPIVDTAPIWLGKKKGFFEDEKLDLTIKTTSGGAAAVPGVVSGDFDLSFGNTVSAMVARDKGLPLEFVANGVSTTGKAGNDFSGVVVKKDSPIKTPADLVGKTVSVNNLKNIGDTTIRHAIEADGGDQSDVDFVEVGFPDAPAALDKGQVDAAWILEPFLSQALANGGRVVSWNYVEMDPKLDIAGYFTTTDYIKQNADVVDGFTAAMKKSLSYAQDHPDEVRDIVGTYTEMDEETRAKMTLPTWRPEFDRAAMEKLAAAAVSRDGRRTRVRAPA